MHNLSALEIGRLVKSRKVSPTEVVLYFLNRIARINPDLNAFVYVKEEEALKAAKVLEDRIAAGEDVGPFAGVPFGLKDFLPSKEGWTNTHGGVACLMQTDPYSSLFCLAMEQAGGIAIGKTNAPAYGFRGTCDNKLYGPTKNPYDYSLNSGGSSGGSAAAVAAGLVPIAEGGDAGGSIRIPAAWCGCYGFKASAGIIPNVCRPDAWAATHPYCTPGGLTKNVEDAAVLLELMSKYDPRDPICQAFPRPKYSHDLDCEVKDLKVAVTCDFGVFPDPDPEIKSKLYQIANLFRLHGAQVDFVKDVVTIPYTSDHLAEIWCRSISLDSAIELEQEKSKGIDLVRDYRGDFPEEFIYWKNRVLRSDVADFYEINETRTHLFDDFRNIFDKYDILLSPVTSCLPVKNVEDGNTLGPEGHERLIGFTDTFLYNWTGNPAASVPVGFSSQGIPVGIQVAADRFNDATVLKVSQFITNH